MSSDVVTDAFSTRDQWENSKRERKKWQRRGKGDQKNAQRSLESHENTSETRLKSHSV